MDLPAGVDAYAALDEFLEMIFADEDFFQDAFAVVVASWNACPPDVPTRIKTASPPPGHRRTRWRARQLGQRSAGERQRDEPAAAAYGPVASAHPAVLTDTQRGAANGRLPAPFTGGAIDWLIAAFVNQRIRARRTDGHY
jgi:hypothetical protein